MSHFAQVKNGIVEQVIVAEQEFINCLPDKENWIQTSYNTRAGLHWNENGQPDGKPALRANYAAIGDTYDSINDVFYNPQPYPSWIIKAPNWQWIPPVDCPVDGKVYTWNEDIKSWDLIS
jgi:hypothetical protein